MSDNLPVRVGTQECFAEESAVVRAPDAEPTIMGLLEIATRGNNIEVVERLVALQERDTARRAKEAFDIAMQAFQDECPIIPKRKEGSRTKTGVLVSKYAPIEDLVMMVKPLLKKHRFRFKVDTEYPDDKCVRVICTVTHAAGHSEPSAVQLPIIPGTNVMTDAQRTSGTVTFAKRLAFANAFGIVTADEDNDGGAGGQRITQDQADELDRMLAHLEWDRNPGLAKFLQFVGAQSIAEIHPAAYAGAHNFLTAKIKAATK